MNRPLDFPLPLRPGMRLKQPEFHRLYERCPPGLKFELIDGVVSMASPERIRHSSHAVEVSGLLWTYAHATPGTHALGTATVLLDEDNEPQPDASLRIRGPHGGATRETEDDYLAGPPELLVEVSHSREKYDLEKKKPEYEQAGVREYLVLALHRQEVIWFDFASGETVTTNRQGVAKSRAFPGLWLCPEALLELDTKRSLPVLNRGLASREHRAFVQRLAKAAAGGSA